MRVNASPEMKEAIQRLGPKRLLELVQGRGFNAACEEQKAACKRARCNGVNCRHLGNRNYIQGDRIELFVDGPPAERVRQQLKKHPNVADGGRPYEARAPPPRRARPPRSLPGPDAPSATRMRSYASWRSSARS